MLVSTVCATQGDIIKRRQFSFSYSTLSLCYLAAATATALAQGISFPTGISPAMQTNAPQAAAGSQRPLQLTDTAGHVFATTYDSQGRMTALKRTTGRNIADMVVGYDAEGRIQVVRFDNGYALHFRYSSDGTQVVADSLGGQVVRSSAGGGMLTVQTVSDPGGHLAETLTRVESVFARVQPVAGLNPVPAATSIR